jgi:hypothetical protein
MGLRQYSSRKPVPPVRRGLAHRELQLHGFSFTRAVYQMPLDYSAEMHLKLL